LWDRASGTKIRRLRGHPELRFLAVLVAALQSASLAKPLLVLNSGIEMEGRYDGGNADTVCFIDDHAGRYRFNITEIQSLVFNRNVGTAAPSGRYVDTDESAGARWRRRAVVPAGVEIVVRTIDRSTCPNRNRIECSSPASDGTYGMPAGGS
jgi:hypothetical protein